MKKTKKIDQTSDWREELLVIVKNFLYQKMQGISWALNDKGVPPAYEPIANLIQSLIDQQEQRHQREMSDYLERIYNLMDVNEFDNSQLVIDRQSWKNLTDQISQSIKDKNL